MKATILLLVSLLPLQAQTPSYGTVALPGATFDLRNAATVLPDRHLTADPGTCVLGERYFNTATAKTRRCTAVNTWSDDGGASYTLPAATGSTLGGVKVGTNLSIDGGGVLSASSGASPACDPFDLNLWCVAEDFVTGALTTGQFGQNGLLWTAISSGTVNYYSVSAAADANHPGIVRILSTTAANSGGTVAVGNTSTTSNLNLSNFLNNDWEIRWIAKLESAAEVRVRVGMSQSGAMAPGTGEISMFFRYDTDAAFADNTKNTVGSWVAQFCGYSGGTCADTAGVYKVLNIQPDANWHLFSLRRSGTTFYWKLDNTDVATMCAAACDMVTPTISNPAGTNPPAPRITFGISGVTQRIIQIDYFSGKITGNFARY